MEPSRFIIEGFADDHQLIKQFTPAHQRYVLNESIQECLDYVSEWMRDHFLKLNDSKTKILVIAPPSIQKLIVIRGTFVHDTCIRFVDCAKNLGLLIDSKFSFEAHVSRLVQTCFSFLRKLHAIKHFLTRDHLISLVCSYIFSRLDYCNSLFYGINSITLNKMQLVQNSAARLVQKKHNITSLDDVFLDFHWLKIKERICYKILLMVYKCLHQLAPESLCKMITFSDRDRRMLLRESRSRSRFGDRAFSHAGPKLWNLLPYPIRNVNEIEVFKKKLKSFLITEGSGYISKLTLK